MKRLKTADKLPPCRECGACCAATYDDGYVADLDLDGVDEERMGPDRLRRMTVVVGYGTETTHRATKAKENRQGHIVCQALRGTVGGICSCAIYRYRPTVCREFPRGSRACLEARREFGLE